MVRCSGSAMAMRSRRWAAALASAVAISGCGGDSGVQAGPDSTATAAGGAAVAESPADVLPPPSSVIATMGSDLPSIIDAVLDDAAKRTGAERSTLVVVSSEAVVWPDGGLGCPEPGVIYTMATVPGYRVLIRAGEIVLDYHATRRGYLVLCPAGRAIDPLPGGST